MPYSAQDFGWLRARERGNAPFASVHQRPVTLNMKTLGNIRWLQWHHRGAEAAFAIAGLGERAIGDGEMETYVQVELPSRCPWHDPAGRFRSRVSTIVARRSTALPMSRCRIASIYRWSNVIQKLDCRCEAPAQLVSGYQTDRSRFTSGVSGFPQATPSPTAIGQWLNRGGALGADFQTLAVARCNPAPAPAATHAR